MSGLLKRISPGIVIFIFFFSVYCFTMTGWTQYGDEIEKYRVAQSIVERGTLSFRPTQERTVLGADGKNYSPYELGQTIPEIPLYILGKVVYDFFPTPDLNQIALLFVGLLNPLVTALTCVLLFHTGLSLGFRPRTALVLTFLFGLGTIAFPYSKSLMREPLLAFLLLLSVYTVRRFEQTHYSFWLLVTGLVSGFLVFTKFIHAVVVPVLWLDLMVIIFLRARSSGDSRRDTVMAILRGTFYFLLPAILLMVIQIFYGMVRFGTFLGGIAGTDVSPVGTIYRFIVNSTPLPAVLGLIASPEKSVFLYSPPIVLAIWGLVALFKRTKLTAWLIIGLLVVEFATAIFRTGWEGGNWWGARYVAQTTPLLILSIGALETNLFDKPRWRWALTVLFVLGVLVQLVGVLGNDRDYLDITAQGPYLVGHLDFLRHAALDSMLVYLSPTGIPLQLNPYGLALLVIIVGSGAASIGFLRNLPVVAASLWSWGVVVLVVGVEMIALVVWVVAPYPQVWAARGNTKFVAANNFLADGRTCEATKMYLIALDRGATFSAQAVAQVEQLSPRPEGLTLSANDLMTDEDRFGNAVLSKDSENTVFGDGALKVSTSARQDVVARGLSYAIPVKPKTNYQVSGWIKAENVYGAGYGVVTVHEDDGAWASARGTDVGNLDETRGWQPFRKTITTLPTTRRVFIAAGLWKTFGTIWVDGVQIAELNNANPPPSDLAAPCLQTGVLKSDLPMH